MPVSLGMPVDAVKIKSPGIKRKFARHVSDWANCRLCPLYKFARIHVLGSGRLPCDVLFVGEAPGDTEDRLGKPFIGPAGKILTSLIDELLTKVKPFTYAITNIVACKPFATGSEIVAPTKEDAETCSPRLLEFIRLAQPKLIVALGKVANEHIPEGFSADIKYIHVWHPSYLRRCGGPTSLEYRKTLLQLVEAFKRL